MTSEAPAIPYKQNENALELYIQTASSSVELSETEFLGPASGTWHTWERLSILSFTSGKTRRISSKLANFDSDDLQKTEDGWRISMEWEAIQPQRVRLLKPILYVFAPESATLRLVNRIYADSFTEPYEVELQLSINVETRVVELDDILPNWEKLLKEDDSTRVFLSSSDEI